MNNQLVMEKLTAAIEAQTRVLAGLQGGDHVKATPAQFMTAQGLHGLGGIFSAPGTERDVITAMVRPQGILSVLERIPSVSEDPTFASITGWTAVTGDEPDNACDDAPQTYIKGCNLTARFGIVRRDTQTLEMDKVMLKVNRGDFTDLVLRGRVLGLQGLQPSGLVESQILNILTMSEMVGTGVAMERALNVGAWQSTVAGNWGWPGLDLQIATGQVDANTNQACPALDSDVKDFNYNDVCGTGLDIVEYMSMMAWYLQYNADTMGLDPVRWVVVMRPGLWYELTACWPCRYLTNRCRDSANTQVGVINDNVNVQMRDRMREGMFIPINGVDYPVIVDTGIYEANNQNNGNLEAGQFASSIYFVPLTITGSFPSTYLEYVDYRQAAVDTALLRGKEDYWWTDSGMFSWAIEQIKWCYKLSLKIEPRIILRTPQLAGKIQNVRYSPLQHLREPDPDSPYHADGGVSIRPTGTRYAVWM